MRTGKRLWTFHTIPQPGEFGNDTWENDSWEYTGNTNVWTLITRRRGARLRLPAGRARRPTTGTAAIVPATTCSPRSLVCVDAEDRQARVALPDRASPIWDYDLPSAPILVDITVDGKPIKAVAQCRPSRRSVYVFDRVTGKPVWPIEERPVPQSDVPGEKTSPTQPFPTKPPAFERQGVPDDDLIDFTPELRAEAHEDPERVRPRSAVHAAHASSGTINLPGWAGGANWWGAAFDPDTGMFYMPSITAPISVKLNKPDARDRTLSLRRGGGRALGGRDRAARRAAAVQAALRPHHGDRPEHGRPRLDGPARRRPREKIQRDRRPRRGPLGSGGGGPLLTKTLLFVGQGGGGRGGRAGGGARRAASLRQGDRQGRGIELTPGPPSGTPMTYLADGKQYIVLATMDRKLVAFGLPQKWLPGLFQSRESQRRMIAMVRTILLFAAGLLAIGRCDPGRLPADAVMLDKVKIAEKQKSVDLPGLSRSRRIPSCRPGNTRA